LSSQILNAQNMIGDRVLELWEQNNILLRQLAAQLDMDTTLLSRIKWCDSFISGPDIAKLTTIFKQME